MLAVVLELVRLTLVAVWYLLEATWKAWVWDPPKSVRGEVVLITGAGHGLGRELASQFAKLGANLVLWDINKEPLEGLVKEITQAGGCAKGYVCDVSSPEEIARVGAEAEAEVGKVAILINNAGIVAARSLQDLSDNDIKKTINVNLLGHIWTIRKFLPSMIANNKGHIVSICSIAGYMGSVNMVDYCASKYGVRGMISALTQEIKELKKDGIHLTIASPVTINTGLVLKPTTRFSWLLPILEPGPTAAAVINAVRRNKTSVVIPSHIEWISIISSMLPHKTQLLFQDFFEYKFEANKKVL